MIVHLVRVVPRLVLETGYQIAYMAHLFQLASQSARAVHLACLAVALVHQILEMVRLLFEVVHVTLACIH